MKYQHKKYDVSIMQSVTVGNIIDALILGIKDNQLPLVVEFLIKKRSDAMMTGLERKAAMKDKGGLNNEFKVSSLKYAGFLMRVREI